MVPMKNAWILMKPERTGMLTRTRRIRCAQGHQELGCEAQHCIWLGALEIFTTFAGNRANKSHVILSPFGGPRTSRDV